MKVVVCGGRGFRAVALLWRELDLLHAEFRFTDLMQGGASGADRIARQWATQHREIRRWVCRAEWTRYNKAAGPIRNARMIHWEPDLVVAAPGGAGTADLIARAETARIPVRRVLWELVPIPLTKQAHQVRDGLTLGEPIAS